jgi:SnoaL-like domain
MNEQLQELLDRKACEDVLLRYGRTLDWLDGEGQAECFWPDADIDYGFFRGKGEDWVPMVMSIEEASAVRWHVSTGILVKVEGDRARSESYGLTMGVSESENGERESHLFGGRYLDELEKRDGTWRISRRTYVADVAHQFPDALPAIIESGFGLNTLDVTASEHAAFRKL